MSGRRGMLPVLAAVAMISAAVPAHADPDEGGSGAGDPAFLAALRSAGLSFTSNERAIAAAHAVCGLIENGESGLQVVKEVSRDNPALSMDDASRFAAIAANAYCPEQLTK